MASRVLLGEGRARRKLSERGLYAVVGVRARRSGRSVAGSVRSIVDSGWWKSIEERVRFVVPCTKGCFCTWNTEKCRPVSLARAGLAAVVEVATNTK